MNKDKIPDEYKMPNSLVRAKRIPSLPMDALKLNVLMHAYSQQGQSSCPIEHVIVPQKARVTVKPYDSVKEKLSESTKQPEPIAEYHKNTASAMAQSILQTIRRVEGTIK